jgi:hypothetical protein
VVATIYLELGEPIVPETVILQGLWMPQLSRRKDMVGRMPDDESGLGDHGTRSTQNSMVLKDIYRLKESEAFTQESGACALFSISD